MLDIGCGRGATCIEAARRGAVRVVGVDLDVAPQTRELISGDAGLAGKVELVTTDGTLRELGAELFDVVLSKNSFEHYAEPESFISTMSARAKPGGLLAVGFGPLWKSPQGDHIEFMTPLPWAHLLFPEDVVLAERRRFRPAELAQSYEGVRGGLNRMTLARFRAIIASSGLECLYFRTNVSDHPVVRAMSLLSRLPPLRELLTTNVSASGGSRARRSQERCSDTSSRLRDWFWSSEEIFNRGSGLRGIFLRPRAAEAD